MSDLENKRPAVYIHADDYGMNLNSSRRILECRMNGCLDGISILPNGCLEEAVPMLEGTQLKRAIHINLVEGKALSQSNRASLLTDKRGYMKHSFLGLLILSMSPAKRKFQKQVYQEIYAQLQRSRAFLEGSSKICLDSHQHVHMIPLIYREMMKAAEDAGFSVDYLRIPAEPLIPYLKTPSVIKTISFVNLIKNILLNLLFCFTRKEFRNSGIKTAVFCGIMFAGNMDQKRVEMVYPAFYQYALLRGMDLELLFHPGSIEKGEKFLDEQKKSFNRFYLSEGRKEEYRALHSLRLEGR